MRRLPVYLLLDCSDSMVGEPLEAMEQGVQLLLRELRRNPHALETVHLSIISFSSVARLVLPLTELSDVQLPPLRMGPGTALGAAVQLLRERLREEVRPTTRDRKGDYLPLVFLLTDGMPTDALEATLRAADQDDGVRIGSLYCVGCGEDVDYGVLQRLGDAVFQLDEMSEEQIRSLFLWLTASIQTASVGLRPDQSSNGTRLELSKTPESVRMLKNPSSNPRPSEPRVITLRAICSRTRAPYLMRYVRGGSAGSYRPVSVHALSPDRLEEEAAGPPELGPIRSSKLLGVAPCGHCEHESAGVCGRCRTLFCLPESSPSRVTCPTCQVEISVREGGDFEIHQRTD